MIAVLLANIRSALALIATSTCKNCPHKPPKWPASSEMSWLEKIGSPTMFFGNKVVESIVSKGLVIPIVSTTSKSASPATFLRGVFITGESCEILSRPEKARKEFAKPINRVAAVSLWFANIKGKSDKNSEKEICVKTVISIAISLAKAMMAPTRLTFALSLMPIQLRIPSSTRIAMVRNNNSWASKRGNNHAKVLHTRERADSCSEEVIDQDKHTP